VQLESATGKSGHAGDRDAAERDVVDIPRFSCGAGGECRLGLPRLCAMDIADGGGLDGFSGHRIYGSRISALQKSDLGGSRRFSFFVVMSEAKTSRVRMAPPTAGAAATDWSGGRVQLTIFGTATSLRFGWKTNERGRRGAGATAQRRVLIVRHPRSRQVDLSRRQIWPRKRGRLRYGR
jgi:hypothetical protein